MFSNVCKLFICQLRGYTSGAHCALFHPITMNIDTIEYLSVLH